MIYLSVYTKRVVRETESKKTNGTEGNLGGHGLTTGRVRVDHWEYEVYNVRTGESNFNTKFP